jgi:hypothetical protein
MIWSVALLSSAAIVGGIVGAVLADRRWSRIHRERMREVRAEFRKLGRPVYRIPVKQRIDAISGRDDLFVPPHTN